MEELDDYEIVENQEVQSPKDHIGEIEGDIPEKEEGVKNSINIENKEESINDYELVNDSFEMEADESISNLDTENYTDYLGKDIYMVGEREDLDRQRAQNQGFFEQTGNFLGQAVLGEVLGGTIEGLGYLLDVGSVMDVMEGDETEWGNFITDFGQSIRKKTQDKFQIHQDPNAYGWGKMADSGWWFSNGVSVASTLSMMIPTMGASKALSFVGKGIGVSKGMKGLRKAAGLAEEMGTKGKWMTQGLSQAVLSRNIENWMEAHGTFEDQKNKMISRINPKTGKNFTEEEATKFASEAAANNWKLGWAMLLQDIPQYLAIGKVFNPVSKKMENALDVASKRGLASKMKPWQQKSLAIGKTFLGEGGEESYQFLISERAKLQADLNSGYITEEQYEKKLKDAFGSEEMLTAAFFGGLGGNLFQAAGSVANSAFKSKDRKEYEESIGKYYTDMLKNDSKQVALMMQHLNNADKEGMVQARESIVNEMMLNLTTKALESNKFDQFYETVSQLSNMSEEDKKSFAEKTGSEFSSELAKQYTPGILKKSLEMKEKYLKHRNNYNPQTSSRLSRLELENSSLEEMINKKEKDISLLRESMGSSWSTKASDKLKSKLEREEDGIVLKKRSIALKENLKNEVDDVRKGFIKKAIEINDLKIKDHKKQSEKIAKENKSKENSEETNEEQSANDKIAESAYSAYEEQIINSKEIKAQAEERFLMNNEDMIFSKSEAGQNKVKAEKVRQDLKGKEFVEELEEEMSEVDSYEFMDDSEKSDVKKQITAKIKEIKKKEAAEELKRKNEEIENEKIEESHENNKNTETADNDNRTPIGDVVEDENFDDEPDFTEEQLKSSEDVVKSKVGTGNMALLDKVNRNGVSQTPGYDGWMENPKDKTGEVFGYTVSERNQYLSEAQNNAIQDFENAKDASSIPQSVYDNLPITATLKNRSKVFTFLPTKPTAGSSEEDIRNYNKGYNEERVIIITKLKKGSIVEAKVHSGSGGGIKSTYDQENKIVPENSLLDIKQIENKINNIDLFVSNKDGLLMDTFKNRERALKYFGEKKMLFSKDKNGNPSPYKGGVFLRLKKANGRPFALKLNFLNNTRKQSELLAELIIKIAVPSPVIGPDGRSVMEENENGEKKLKLQDKDTVLKATISELDEGLREDIKEHMAPELEMLDKKYKDPTLVELINAFVYLSNETKGKSSELYMSGNDLFFGGERISPGYKNNEGLQEKLIEFFHTDKKRQFNLKLWNENDDYKRYVLENKIINTDAPIDGPVFTDTREKLRDGTITGRRVQLYMESVGSKSTPNKAKFKKGQKFSMKDLGIRSVADPDAVDNTLSTSTSPSKQPTQQTSDTQIRKKSTDKVSLPKKKISGSYINVSKSNKKSKNISSSNKPKMGRKRPKNLNDSDSGTAKEDPNCTKS